MRKCTCTTSSSVLMILKPCFVPIDAPVGSESQLLPEAPNPAAAAVAKPYIINIKGVFISTNFPAPCHKIIPITIR